MRGVANCIILLKPKIVHINTIKSVCKTIGYHGAIGVAIEDNGCTALTLKKIWANNVSTPQTTPNSLV